MRPVGFVSSVGEGLTMGDWGATVFGVIIGWCLYFNMRDRKSQQMGDVAAMIGAVGGAAVLALFPGARFSY